MGSVKYTAFFVFSRGYRAADVSVLTKMMTGQTLKLVQNTKFTYFERSRLSIYRNPQSSQIFGVGNGKQAINLHIYRTVCRKARKAKLSKQNRSAERKLKTFTALNRVNLTFVLSLRVRLLLQGFQNSPTKNHSQTSYSLLPNEWPMLTQKEQIFHGKSYTHDLGNSSGNSDAYLLKQSVWEQIRINLRQQNVKSEFRREFQRVALFPQMF